VRRLALTCLVALCGCSPQPGPAAHLTMAEIGAIVTPLTYREVLGQKCNEPNTAVKTAFLADLKAAGASETLLAEATAEADRIIEAERETPAEYVCTADLFESTEKNAADAQAAWTKLKSKKP